MDVHSHYPDGSADWSVRTVDQEFFRVDVHSDGLLWLHRKPNPYPDLDAVRRGYLQWLSLAAESVAERAPESRRASVGVIYDVRNAPPARNDVHFEAVHEEMRKVVYRRTRAFLVLVRSAAGLMQMARMGREDGSHFMASQDEREAVRLIRDAMATELGRPRV